MLVFRISEGFDYRKTTVVLKIVEQLPYEEIYLFSQGSAKRYDNLIVPQGGNNHVAIDILTQYILRILTHQS